MSGASRHPPAGVLALTTAAFLLGLITGAAGGFLLLSWIFQ